MAREESREVLATIVITTTSSGDNARHSAVGPGTPAEEGPASILGCLGAL